MRSCTRLRFRSASLRKCGTDIARYAEAREAPGLATSGARPQTDAVAEQKEASSSGQAVAPSHSRMPTFPAPVLRAFGMACGLALRKHSGQSP